MSRSAVSPRVFQPYSPRHPSPLGLPPFTPRRGSQDIIPSISSSAYPKTPERYYLQHYSAESSTSSHGMRFPPEVVRRHTPSSSTQRTTTTTRASPPAPLSLDSQYHPAAAIVVHLPSIEETLQQSYTTTATTTRAPPSPTPSSTSSLSLYSAESAKKSLEIEEGKDNKKGGGGGFCFCFNFFGTKSKPNKILAPQAQQVQVAAEPGPAPQMVQPRRRPASLVL